MLKTYLTVTAVLGALSIVQSVRALLGGTQSSGESCAIFAISIIWILVSFAMLFAFSKRRVTLAVPACYLVFELLGVVYTIGLVVTGTDFAKYATPNWWWYTGLAEGVLLITLVATTFRALAAGVTDASTEERNSQTGA